MKNKKNVSKQYYDKSTFGKKSIIDIVMNFNLFILWDPIHSRILFYLATKSWALWINKYKIYIIEISKTINSAKTLGQFSIKP